MSLEDENSRNVQAECTERRGGGKPITRRTAIAALAGAATLNAGLPSLALAEDAADAAEATVQGSEDTANSWRYEDGRIVAHPDTDSQDSTLSTLANTEDVSTWSAENGTDSFYIGTGTYNSSNTLTGVSEHSTVTVEGVQRVGIDVSKWNGSIDWNEVADDGIGFAIIRCGYGSDDTDQDDPYWVENATGARAAGLDIGVYLYSYATATTGSDGSAESEAAHVIRLLNEASLEPEDVALPIFLDMEDSTQAACSASTLGSIAQTFCDAIQAEGYLVGIYANKNWWTNYLTDSAFDNPDWYRWVARYPSSTSVSSSGVDDTDIWQFTSAGKVSGTESTWTDVNFDYLGADGYSSTGLPFSVQWSSHVQSIGTKTGSSRATTFSFGTTGMSKRLEAFSLELSGAELAGSITYRAHCQTYGWQDWVSDGTLAGTTGKSKRLEALRIKFTGDMAEAYDIYYRAHCQTYGWLDWAKNGAVAGTTGLSKRVEAVQIYITEKDGGAPGDETTPYVNAATPSISAHVQTYGWLTAVGSGSTAGTTGKSKRLEALKISFDSEVAGSITYRVHCQTYGWLDWVSDGAMAGTTGESKRLEAVQIKLSGEAANNYVVWYRVHAQTYGWLGWACNGATAGTTGLSKRLEAIQVQILAKNASAPGSTSKPYISK